MGITIHYFTERGNHLDPEKAAQRFETAIAIASETAARLGWEALGERREEGRWYLEHSAGQCGSSCDGTGTVRSAAWNPDPGSETFALEWVEGTGILPYAFCKTQFSKDRLRVHAQLCDLLERLNREAFDGKLVIHDEGDYLPGRSLDRLAAAFGENEAAIRRLVDAARNAGWNVATPLDDMGIDTYTP